jgi:CMP-N,N'-diacetyllegionaminic acid synthase
MINGKSILAIIPARGGSKGVVGKNIRDLAGKPLLAWTIEAAGKSQYIDRCILSSEDPEIIATAIAWGCEVPFVRPIELAQDETPGMEPVMHAINHLAYYDYIVLLQPTSPLRTVDDIDACIALCFEKNANACVSVTEPDKSPFWMYTLSEHNQMNPLMESHVFFLRRQDMPKTVALNGAVYVAKRDWLLLNRSFMSNETIAYEMPKERSLDIDTEFDLKLVKAIIRMADIKENME